MTLLGDAYVRVRPDTKGFEKETKGRMGGIGKKAALAFGAAFAAVGVGKVIGSAITEASDLGESINAVNVSFGDAAEGVKTLGENAARSLGLSNNEFNSLAVRFSSFSKTIAGEGGDVVGTLDDLTGRAADFASVMNLDVSKAAEIFQSGLAGQSEPLRAYGIDMSAATIETYAYANGITEAGETMTEQEKVQARYGSLMEQTAMVQGDFANTSDSLANSQRILGAEWTNLKAKAGNALVPALASVSTVVGSKLLPAMEDLGAGAKQAWDILFKGDFKGGPLGEEDSAIVDKLFDLRDVFVEIGEYLGGKFKDAYERISKAVADNKEEFTELLDGLKSVAVYIAQTMTPILVALVGEAIDLVSAAIVFAVENLDILKAILVPVIATWGAYKVITMAVTAVTKAHTIATGLMTAAQTALNTVMKANPIGLVISLLAGLTAGLLYAWHESETFREIVVGAFNAMKDAAATGIGFVVENMAEMALSVLEAADLAFGWIPGLDEKFETAKANVKGFKEATNTLLSEIKDKDIVLDVKANGSWQMSEARAANEHQARRPGNYATGGAVRGPGSGTSDDVPAWLSNNEHVWTAKEVANAGGHAAVEAMRSKFKYAKGGAVKIHGMSAEEIHGLAIKNYDPTESALLNEIAKATAKQIQASELAGGGFQKNSKGWPPRQYWKVASNTAAAAAMVRNRWGVPVGTLGARGNTSDHPYGKALDAMIPNYKSAAGIAMGNQIASYFTGNPGQFGTKYVIWRDKINSGGGWRPYQHPSGVYNDTTQHRDHPHVSLYDNGGVLDNLSMAYNKSGKPEAVLTNPEWKMLEQIARSGGSPSTPDELVIVDVNGDLIGRMRVEALDATGLGNARQKGRTRR